MKISYNWLKEFISVEKYTPEQLAEILLSIGFEVSDVMRTGGQGLEKVVSARVIDVSKHPNANNLSLCRLTDGEKEHSVVCGAKNVAAGDLVPLALPGSALPGGAEIKTAVLRGIKSEGMICSSKELGIDDEHAGIMHLDPETPLGQSVGQLLGLDDYIMDVEVHANRPDCLGHLGVARELAAKLGITMHHLHIHTTEKTGVEFFPVEVLNPELCTRYIACVLNDAKVGPSGLKVKIRLKNCGLRPINNAVDVTNYVLLEFGHPLHVFDIDKLAGQKITIRNAREGESLLALDGKEYKLDAQTLVIADNESPVAIAGIIGGAGSGVTESTKRVLLESALFDAPNIRMTRQRLQTATESSYRFERSLSWEICQLASQRAVHLLTQFCSANYISRTDVKTSELRRKKIILRPTRVDKILAVKSEKKEMAEILTRLGMTVTPQAEYLNIEVPSWRQDVDEEIDLIEEIARHKGYDKIPSEERGSIALKPSSGETERAEEKIRKVLHAAGFFEAMNYSMVPEKTPDVAPQAGAGFSQSPKESAAADNAGQSRDSGAGAKEVNAGAPVPALKRIEIENPISQEFRFLRMSLAGGLLANVEKNVSNQNDDVKLYEFGRVYAYSSGEHSEERRLGLVCAGAIAQDHWKYENQKTDFYFISGIALAILRELGIAGFNIGHASLLSSLFHPGKSAAAAIGERLLCEYGEVKPGIFNEIHGGGCYAEFFMDNILSESKALGVFEPYLNLPKLKRDVSLIAPEGLPYENVLEGILACAGEDLKIAVQLFDMYRGERIPSDKKALGLRLTFSHKSRTLEDKEVNKKIGEILGGLKKLNVTLRNA
jgi:phenylalanyl-tRNA synthetase beta chain